MKSPATERRRSIFASASTFDVHFRFDFDHDFDFRFEIGAET